MNNSFNNFTISIFQGCSFEDFYNTIIGIESFEKDRLSGDIVISNANLDITTFFNPEYGNTSKRFVWWNNKKYPNTVLFVSNSPDGLYSYCKEFRKRLNCTLIFCRMSLNGKCRIDDIAWFQHINEKGNDRVVYALKENRWIFHQSGEPLIFEDLNLYKNKRIKERINFDVICNYLQELGYNIMDIDSNVEQCMSFTRKIQSINHLSF